VLIAGETGTGKELVARAIHAASVRRSGPFVAVNCAAVPRELFESELFGAEPGAYTGAVRRPGRFEQAQGGTLFLDEIGELSLGAQATLLRVLDEKRVQRLGGTRAVAVDVRLLSATNVDLAAAAKDGRFRSDLLYRLRQMSIRLPPLRERGADLEELIDVRLQAIALGAGVAAPALTPEARQALLAHDWPGNVRELEHALMHAIGACDGARIERSLLPVSVRLLPERSDVGSGSTLPADMKRFERLRIEAVLARHATLRAAARELGLSVKALYRRRVALGLVGTARRIGSDISVLHQDRSGT